MTTLTINLPPDAPRDESAVPAQSLLRKLLGDTLSRWGAVAGLGWVIVLVLAAVFAPFLASSFPLVMKMDGQWSSPLLVQLELVDVVLLVATGAAAVLGLLWRVSIGTRLAIGVLVVAVALPAAGWHEGVERWQWAMREVKAGPRLFAQIGLIVALIVDVAVGTGMLSLLVRRLRAAGWIVLVTVLMLLGVGLALVPVSPPATVVYERYRTMAREGQIEFALYAPLRFSPNDRLRDQPMLRLTGPSVAHPMGTTVNGADVLANMIYGTRIALSIGFISTGIAIVIGVIIGGLMGYFSGWVDLLGMRLVEVFASIPTLFLLLAFVAFFEPNLYIMMAIIGVTGWVGYCYYIRAEFLKLRQQDFVQAAVAAGLPLRSILFRHMLPNGITPVLVSASFGVAGAILAESTLSFLGIGLVDEASWGKLLNQALGVGGTFYWWIALYPGLAIFLTVFAYNLVGEALRDAIDPRTNRSR